MRVGPAVEVESVLYSGRKFRLEMCRVEDRDGVARRYERIWHPGAAVILPLLADGRVGLIRVHRFAVGQSLLELPAGTIDPPESPADCAARELAEETGFRAGRLDHLVSFFSTPGICVERMHAFVASELTTGDAQCEPGERIELEPMEYSMTLAAIADGRIQDSKTIVALLYFDRFVRSGR